MMEPTESESIDFSGWPISEVYKAASECLLILGTDPEIRAAFHRQVAEEFEQEIEDFLS